MRIWPAAGEFETPASSRRCSYQFYCPLVVLIIALGLYLWTLAPTVTLVDSGELIVAARTLGVAHPPGFPLYLLLAHLISLLPVGGIALRVNLASALFAAVAASVLSLAVLEIITIGPFTDDRWAAIRSRARKGPQPRGAESNRNLAGWYEIVPALTAGLLIGSSRTLWAYATVTEVYTLNALMIMLVILFMLRWRRLGLVVRRRAGKLGRGVSDGVRDRWLNAAALTFGLALGVHHVTVGLLLPAFAALVFATEGWEFFTGRRLLIAAAFAIAGLSVYLYLPLAAARTPVMNWGDPRTLDHFLAHVTGWQYQVYFDSQPRLIGRQMADFGMRALREFGPVWLPLTLALAGVGLAWLYRHAREVFWFLVIAIVANLAYNANYEIAEDKDAYYLPVFLALALASGLGVRYVIESVRVDAAQVVMRSRVIVTALMIAVPGISLAANFAFDNRRHHFIARDYVENIMATIAPGGMLLTLDWQVYSPMLYLRELESFRRDAVVIDINQLRRSWYFAYLEYAYPQEMNRVRSQAGAFLEDLRRWEHDPALYQRDAVLNRRISTRFREMILALVAGHLQSAPVYITLDIATNPEAGDSNDWSRQMARKYQLAPQGLVFQLFPDRDFHEPAHPVQQVRGLADGSLRFADDDAVKVKVLPVYVAMRYNRGRYLAVAHRMQEAADAYREALALDPAFLPAQQALADLRLQTSNLRPPSEFF